MFKKKGTNDEYKGILNFPFYVFGEKWPIYLSCQNNDSRLWKMKCQSVNYLSKIRVPHGMFAHDISVNQVYDYDHLKVNRKKPKTRNPNPKVLPQRFKQTHLYSEIISFSVLFKLIFQNNATGAQAMYDGVIEANVTKQLIRELFENSTEMGAFWKKEVREELQGLIVNFWHLKFQNIQRQFKQNKNVILRQIELASERNPNESGYWDSRYQIRRVEIERDSDPFIKYMQMKPISYTSKKYVFLLVL